MPVLPSSSATARQTPLVTAASKQKKKRARNSDDDGAQSDTSLSPGPGASTPQSQAAVTGTHSKRGRPRTVSESAEPRSLLPVIRKAKASQEWDYDSDDHSSLGLSGFDDENRSTWSKAGPSNSPRIASSSKERSKSNTIRTRPRTNSRPTEPSTFSKAVSPVAPLLNLPSDHTRQQHADLSQPCLCRVGELVWCRLPQSLVNLGSLHHGDFRKVSHWPGVIIARHDFPTVSTYDVSLLAIRPDETLQNVHGDDVVPWLGFVPYELTMIEVGQAVQVARYRTGTSIHKRASIADIVAGGPLVLRAFWFAACEAGRQLASVHVLGPAKISTGAHLTLASDSPTLAADANQIRALYVARPGARTLLYDYVYFGPELLHCGEFVRLTSEVELPLTVTRLMSDKSPMAINTSLVLHVTMLLKTHKESTLIARGKVYEMATPDNGTPSPDMLPVPLLTSSASSSSGESLMDNEDRSPLIGGGMLPLPTLRTPMAFPGHKMRCLTPGPHDFVDVPLPQIAGRLHPLGMAMQNDVSIVDDIIERARATGIRGEVGRRPISLLLGGLVTGAGVPQIDAPDCFTSSQIASTATIDERRRMECELDERLRLSDAQGFLASGLDAPLNPVTKPLALPAPNSAGFGGPTFAGLSYPSHPSFLPGSIPAYPSPMTPGGWSPASTYKQEGTVPSMYPFPNVEPVPVISASNTSWQQHAIRPPLTSKTQQPKGQTVDASAVPTVVIRPWG
ncbi:hypothetical protein OIO90_005577 [Microbotryomycetes sp. JL221]|nr:hypothetical protein OIO90_005577 [Microbotryomycetes sp. JL221]